MHRHNMIRITILVSVLALNPLIATEFQCKIETRCNKRVNISGTIASLLHKRGLDEDAAKKIAEAWVDKDEARFAQMVENLTSVLPHAEMMEYLTTMALHRKKIRLDSYDHLVRMASKIRKNVLDKEMLAQLHIVATLNSQLIG